MTSSTRTFNGLNREVTEEDIHAYVDGMLDARTEMAIEAMMEQNPDLAQRIEDYRAQNDVLKGLYREVLSEPLPERMERLLTAQRSVLARPAMAAMVVLLCGLSAFSGWYANGAVSGSAGGPAVDHFLNQIANHAATQGGPAAGVSLAAADMAGIEPLNWLTQKVALEMQAPDLSALGYELVGRKLITRSGTEYVELAYHDPMGKPLTLYLKTRWDRNAPEIRFVDQGDMSFSYWEEGPLVYVLAGQLGQDDSVGIVELVRDTMRKRTVPGTQPAQVQPPVELLDLDESMMWDGVHAATGIIADDHVAPMTTQITPQIAPMPISPSVTPSHVSPSAFAEPFYEGVPVE